MKFESQWLYELLEGAPEPDRLAERLTDCGFLVELREPGDGAEIWDVEVTTNRPDAMNHRGLAREAAVATGTPLKPLEFELDEGDEAAAALAAVEIADDAPCSRYVARVIRAVRVGPSPEWMQRRLVNCGVRPINAVVDATNYVLLELGQPLHAFDLGRLSGRRIVVRRAAAGERLKTLDGVERELDPSMLMIADGERVVALAGIMGGADSEIQGATSEVLLESAHFDSLSVRRTARRLGMHTEASHRFERGCDPEMAAVACDRAAALIAELTGGEVARGRIDVNPQPWRARAMAFRASALSSFAGLEIPVERMVEILRGLDFGPEASGDTVRVAVPPFRVDIEREADLYEEVIRHVGYGAVPAVLPVLATSPGQRNVNWELVDRAREAAVAAGLTEIITWSFVDEASDTLAAESPLCPGPAVELANPLATTQSVMRRSLLPGVLAAVGFNLNQGERRLAVFEQGRVFSRGGERPLEGERLAIAVVGGEHSRADGFLRLKGVVEQLAAEIGLGSVTWKRGGEPWLDRGFGAVLEVPENRVVGTAGLLADNASARWDLRSDVFVAELDLDQSNPPLTPRFEALPRFPSVVMDMTVEHHGELAYAELEDAVRELAGEWAESVSFVPPQFPLADGSGRVRTTLRVVYRHPERSLTQDEVNAARERLRGELGERLQVDFA